MMYEEKWGEIVSAWLFEDSKLRKKSRRTKKKIFHDLVELGFKGSYRTICYFISEWENSHVEGKDKGFERLEHPPSDVQVDFGVMEAVQDGELVDIHTLVMSFPYSNAGFAVSLPSQNQECFLYGLKQLFHQIGGVPRRIRIDNLTPAVKCQRQYLESMGLQGINKPNVDSISGLSPAISIGQQITNRNPRSTVGTMTDMYTSKVSMAREDFPEPRFFYARKGLHKLIAKLYIFSLP